MGFRLKSFKHTGSAKTLFMPPKSGLPTKRGFVYSK